MTSTARTSASARLASASLRGFVQNDKENSLKISTISGNAKFSSKTVPNESLVNVKSLHKTITSDALGGNLPNPNNGVQSNKTRDG